MKYPTIRIEGSILASDILEKIEQGEITGQRPIDFKIEGNFKVKDEIARSWADAKDYWRIFQRKREALGGDEKKTGTSETRSQWMIPFLSILGFKIEFAKSEEVNGKSYAISHRDNSLDGFPVHIMGFKDSLDKKRVDSGPRMSPHALVQEYLNLTEHLYAIATNGMQIRLLRDSSRLIKLSYIEFDLERMMEEEHYADFAILFRLLHYTRMPINQEAIAESLMEKYHQDSLESGSRIRDGLSDAVKKSIKIFANGFLSHPDNLELRKWFEEGDHNEKEMKFFQWQLRLIYRLLFLMVMDDELSVKSSQYNVNDYQWQIVNLARTTLRNIIGTLTLKSANSERDRINSELLTTLSQETQNWGMAIVRTELKEIDPPKDVQETMNKVVKAENEKIAALDYANAVERQADGQKRSEIKKAEGVKQGKILKAEGEAEAIRLVNEAANQYFVGNAQLLRKLEAVEKALSENAKVVIPTGSELVNVIGEMAGVLPLSK